jgi:pyruvate,water dikinase
MTYTIPFAQLDKNSIPTAGGKGANLGELAAAVLPIPPGFVLTTEAYDHFVEANGLQQQIIDLASKASAGDPQSSEHASVAIKALFLAADMPEAIRVDLLAAYAGLTAAGETAVAGEPQSGSLEQPALPVAVRSSATAEDLPEASFAGQQETHLNVQGQDALLDAVVHCWASLWTARAISYRLHQGIDPATLSLAVVVQQFIPAEAAGALFTANPVSGERDQIVINATWGLGEAIVGGQVTPDTVIVDKSDQKIVSRETATKTIMTVPTEGGTLDQPVPQAQQNQPAIDDVTAVELAQYGVQIEAHYGRPMDIEWALTPPSPKPLRRRGGGEGSIAILQARPITGLPPAPLKDVRWEPIRPGTIWMRRQVVEHMPEPLSPLFDELYLQQGLDRSMDEMAVFLSALSGIEIDVWEFIDPPFAATINGYAYSVASFNFSWQLVPIALRMYSSVLPKMIRYLVPRWQEESLPAYRAAAARWKSLDLADASDEDLLRGVRELALADAVYWFAAAVPLGFARVADAALDRFVRSALGGRSASYLRGLPSKAMTAQAHLEEIARAINESDALRELALDTPAPRLLQALAGHPSGESILDELQQYQDEYGHQIYNLDFAASTLADDPLPVLLSLKTAVAHPERDARARQAEMAQEREALVARTVRSLNPVQRRIFQMLLGWAQRFTPIREEALFYVGAGWPALRRLALELGRRLTETGSLNTPGDVFFLRSEELAAASTARAKGASRGDLAALARERRDLREARKRLDPPVVVPPGGRLRFGPIDMSMFEPKPRTPSTGPTLEGFAVSPGQVTAPASIVRSPEEFDKMAPDTILVCPTTTPAWTPLFAQAKGLVTDIGGALAHGSIVAREYGIPAVMGTGEATQRIKDGERILVDGDSGTVTLVHSVDPQEEERKQAQRLAEKQSAARKRKVILGLTAAAVVVLAVLWKKRQQRAAR